VFPELPITHPTDPLPLLPAELLRRHWCTEPTDTRFRAIARLRQSLWRETQDCPCGRYVDQHGRTRRLGSRVSNRLGRTGVNLIDPGPLKQRPGLTTALMRAGGVVAAPVIGDASGPAQESSGYVTWTALCRSNGAYDQDGVAASITERHPAAAIIVPPRSNAMPSETAETAPTQRDRHLRQIAQHGRMAWQTASGYTKGATAETGMARFKQVIGDGPRSHMDERQAPEVEVAVHVPNRLFELGRPNSVRSA